MQKEKKVKLQGQLCEQKQGEHSLFYVANSIKKILSSSTGLQQLFLQIKCSLKTLCEDQELQKDLILNSQKYIQVVNGKDKNMPKIKSQAGIQAKKFMIIDQNLTNYSKKYNHQIWEKQRVDVVLDGTGQKFSYIVGSNDWVSIKKFKIFKPFYQIISEGDNMRIAFSRKKVYKQRVLRDLKDNLSQITEKNKGALRFKFQTDYQVNKLYKITLNKILQTSQQKIIKKLKNEIYENDGKLLDFFVQKIIQEYEKQLKYEVQIRFNNIAMKEFEIKKVQQIQLQLQKAIFFLNQFKKAKEQESKVQKLMQNLKI